MSDNGNRDAVQWGPEIAVDGKRPEWLNDDDVCSIDQGNGWLGQDLTAKSWIWEPVKRIKLRADHAHYRQASSIDWTAPIEAMHADGRVVPVHFTSWNGFDANIGKPDKQGDYYTNDPEGEKGRSGIWEPDGCAWSESRKGWRIRNVAQTTRTTDEQLTHYAERCKALVERMAASSHDGFDVGPRAESFFIEADSIVASMVEVDPDLIVAREIAKDVHPSYDYTKGDCDKWPIVQASIAAIRRGRALERGE